MSSTRAVLAGPLAVARSLIQPCAGRRTWAQEAATRVPSDGTWLHPWHPVRFRHPPRKASLNPCHILSVLSCKLECSRENPYLHEVKLSSPGSKSKKQLPQNDFNCTKLNNLA